MRYPSDKLENKLGPGREGRWRLPRLLQVKLVSLQWALATVLTELKDLDTLRQN